MTAMSSRSGSPRRALGWWPLAVVAGGTVLFGALGVLPRWPGLVHAVAIPPLDVAFDLRVLVAKASSYPIFLIGALVSLAVRSLILAMILGAVGSEALFRQRLIRAVRFYLVVWIPVALAAGLFFVALAAHYHWYYWAGLGAVLVTSVAAVRLPSCGLRFRRVLVYLFLLTAIGGLAGATGWWGSVALVPVSTALTVAALGYRRRERRKPLASAVSVLAMACVSAAMLPSFGVVSMGARRSVQQQAVLLLVPGVDTSSGHGAMYRFDPSALGLPCYRVFYYSYLGPGRGTPRGEAPCPIRFHAPYGQADTQLSIEQLSNAFAKQIAAIRETVDGAPVVVVTHSQGNLIAWRAISRSRSSPVSHLVMLAGFAENSASYPARGEDGSGRVGGDFLRGITGLTRRMEIGTFDPDAPLARQILATAGGAEAILSDPLPSGVLALGIEATFDAPVYSGRRSLPGVRDGGTVDTTHVGLVTSTRTAYVVRRFLASDMGARATQLALVLRWITPAFGSPPYDA